MVVVFLFLAAKLFCSTAKKQQKTKKQLNVSSQDEPLFPGSWMSGFLRWSFGRFELIVCVATSGSAQPHAEVQKVRWADSEMDGAVRAHVSRESRCHCECVTDVSNPLRKHLGCCCSCTDYLLDKHCQPLSCHRCGGVIYLLIINVRL